jgi:hypothetical protein
LVGDPSRRGATLGITRRHRALDRQYLADLRRQLVADGGQLVVGQLLQPNAAVLSSTHGGTSGLVCGSERNSLAHEPFSDIGGQRVPGWGQRCHPLDVERKAGHQSCHRRQQQLQLSHRVEHWFLVFL